MPEFNKPARVRCRQITSPSAATLFSIKIEETPGIRRSNHKENAR